MADDATVARRIETGELSELEHPESHQGCTSPWRGDTALELTTRSLVTCISAFVRNGRINPVYVPRACTTGSTATAWSTRSISNT